MKSFGNLLLILLNVFFHCKTCSFVSSLLLQRRCHDSTRPENCIILTRSLNFMKCQSKDQPEEVVYWHKVLNHLNSRDLKKMENVLNIKVDPSIPISCLSCTLGKFIRFPFPKVKLRSSGPLEIIHSDTSGIIRIPNFHNFRYYISFIDDYTRYQMIFMLSKKYQALDAFIEYKSFMENQLDVKIKRFHTDNGTEYVNNLFSEFLSKNGIHHEKSVPYSPQTMGVAERLNRTLAESARSNLIEANLSERFWSYAVGFSAYTKNYLPNSFLNGRIPAEYLFGKEVNYEKLRKFGSICIVLNLEVNGKFDLKGKPALFVGYPTNHSGYEVYLLEDKKFTVSREVHFLSKFEEDQFLAKYGNLFPVLKDKINLNRLGYEEDDNTQDRFVDSELNSVFTVSDDSSRFGLDLGIDAIV